MFNFTLLFIYLFLAASHSLWDFSSLIKDQNLAIFRKLKVT